MARGAADSLSAIHASSSRRSLAVCQRRSGSFARHLLTVRSSAAGIDGSSVVRGGGSSLRIDAISPAWLDAWKARRPVSIS